MGKKAKKAKKASQNCKGEKNSWLCDFKTKAERSEVMKYLRSCEKGQKNCKLKKPKYYEKWSKSRPAKKQGHTNWMGDEGWSADERRQYMAYIRSCRDKEGCAPGLLSKKLWNWMGAKKA